jgi:predicted dehydrogenase
MIRYGVIGTGKITEEFIIGAQDVDGLKLAAVYSRTERRGEDFAQKFGSPVVYTNIESFASSDIDAVYVASPNSLHYEQSKLMLENGKHVICEKPITVTPEELRELECIAEEKGLVYMEAIMYLYSPARELLINSIKRIGKITSAHFDYSQFSSRYAQYKRGELPNVFNPKFAGGCLMDLGIYCVYPALDFLGIPQKISSSAGFIKTGADGYGSTIFDFSDKQVTLTYSKLAQSYSGSQILGDEGTITVGSISQLQNIEICRHDGSRETICGYTPKTKLMGYEAKAFYLYITQREAYRHKYNYARGLALDVSEVMQNIREKCSILFPKKE